MSCVRAGVYIYAIPSEHWEDPGPSDTAVFFFGGGGYVKEETPWKSNTGPAPIQRTVQ